MFDLLTLGDSNRSVVRTDMNDNSSRSHMMLTVTVVRSVVSAICFLYGLLWLLVIYVPNQPALISYYCNSESRPNRFVKSLIVVIFDPVFLVLVQFISLRWNCSGGYRRVKVTDQNLPLYFIFVIKRCKMID